jgi:hypothetical protein
MVSITWKPGELEKRQQKAKPIVYQALNQQQKDLVNQIEMAKCSYRENIEDNTVDVWYDGFPLIQIHKSHFKEAKDFRDYPRIAEDLMSRFRGKKL